MLVSRSEWAHGELELCTTLALGRELRAHSVRRRVLAFDTRFSPGSARERDVVTIYLVVSGWIEPRGSARVEGPSAWVLAEDEFERCRSERSFRTGGEPLVAVDVCVPRTRVRVPVGLARGPAPVSPPVVAAAAAMAAARTEEAIGEAFTGLALALADAGWIDAALVREAGEAERPSTLRLWRTLTRFYSAHETGAYLPALADVAGVSLRQLERDAADVLERIGLGGFRATLRTLRLRRAVTLLSAPSLSVEEVARIVGYGSSDSLGRAFRDAGLPSPSVVASELRR